MGVGRSSTSTTSRSARREALSYTATTMLRRSGVRCAPMSSSLLLCLTNLSSTQVGTNRRRQAPRTHQLTRTSKEILESTAFGQNSNQQSLMFGSRTLIAPLRGTRTHVRYLLNTNGTRRRNTPWHAPIGDVISRHWCFLSTAWSEWKPEPPSNVWRLFYPPSENDRTPKLVRTFVRGSRFPS